MITALAPDLIVLSVILAGSVLLSTNTGFSRVGGVTVFLVSFGTTYFLIESGAITGFISLGIWIGVQYLLVQYGYTLLVWLVVVLLLPLVIIERVTGWPIGDILFNRETENASTDRSPANTDETGSTSAAHEPTQIADEAVWPPHDAFNTTEPDTTESDP